MEKTKPMYKITVKDLIPFYGLANHAKRNRGLNPSRNLMERAAILSFYNATIITTIYVGLEKLLQ